MGENPSPKYRATQKKMTHKLQLHKNHTGPATILQAMLVHALLNSRTQQQLKAPQFTKKVARMSKPKTTPQSSPFPPKCSRASTVTSPKTPKSSNSPRIHTIQNTSFSLRSPTGTAVSPRPPSTPSETTTKASNLRFSRPKAPSKKQPAAQIRLVTSSL
eukprot:m.158259 g.158259  ORF g.158259 m.158259 type:complete len:159 (+) comp15132_c0_seq6:141-617(+)